ncbi:aromatic motif membrane protein [Mycoplasmopsis edwardii]|uniref:Uncharacterized protein n=1 Tax=Mycoplasmopsis edwardii TaxID=53558 RepID=A0ACD4PI22_9BACT|nr:aromatic motif membrane protein [Mycoplasmopsis edwardii]WBP84322.1 hypothetical protein Me_995_000302 [Mycoplasmopsis edwardii]
MKKLLKTSLLLASVVTTSGVLVSCSTSKNYQENQEAKSPYASLIREDNKVNPILKEFTSQTFFKNNSNSENEFYNQQLSIDKKFYNELNISLTFAPLFIPRVTDGNVATEFTLKQAIRSSYIVEETLSQKWLWYLENIKNFTFIFNNWNSLFKDYRNVEKKKDLTDQEIFKKVQEEKQLLKTFENYSIVQVTKSHMIERLKSDEYNNLRIQFVVLKSENNNYALLPFFLYEIANNETQILVTGDIFSFKNQLSNVEEVAKNLANLISQGRKYFLKLTLDYQENLNDLEDIELEIKEIEKWIKIKENTSSNESGNDGEEDEDEDNEYKNLTLEELKTKLQEKQNQITNSKEDIQNRFTPSFRDKNYLTIYNENSYMNSFYYATNEFNKENSDNEIKRYTWGYIDEK